MDKIETQATLETRHRTKTNITTTKSITLKTKKRATRTKPWRETRYSWRISCYRFLLNAHRVDNIVSSGNCIVGDQGKEQIYVKEE